MFLEKKIKKVIQRTTNDGTIIYGLIWQIQNRTVATLEFQHHDIDGHLTRHQRQLIHNCNRTELHSENTR